MNRTQLALSAAVRIALVGATAFTLFSAVQVLGGPARHPGLHDVQVLLVADVPQGALPPGHPPLDGCPNLPPGHPPIMSELPPGHPPVNVDRLPAGHPPVDGTRPAPVIFPQEGTSSI
ncbi:MAG TPA: hypothetical protein PLL32_09815 [Anaeromyxobacteraceae bacterium]|nr:hypothetical protein [Anaeromyxobacteraceae bacterium]